MLEPGLGASSQPGFGSKFYLEDELQGKLH